MNKRFWMATGVVLAFGLMGCLSALGHFVQASPPAQAPQTSLPLSQSLIVAYRNGTTRLLHDVIPLGNRESGAALHGTVQISDTLYYRGYLQFDTTGIPPASTVLTANLNLYVDRFEYAGAVPYGESVQGGVYQVIQAWTEPPGPPWDWADNPAVLTPTTNFQAVPFDQRGWYTWDVRTLVQEWVNTPETNHGLLVGAYPNLDQVGRMTVVILGPTALSETLHPNLTVTYATPTPTPTVSPTPTEPATPTVTPSPTSPPPTAQPQPTNPPPAPPTPAPTMTPTLVSLLPISGETKSGPTLEAILLVGVGGLAILGLGAYGLGRARR